MCFGFGRNGMGGTGVGAAEVAAGGAGVSVGRDGGGPDGGGGKNAARPDPRFDGGRLASVFVCFLWGDLNYSPNLQLSMTYGLTPLYIKH